jgi:D-lyxose ketol-isomerase
MKRSEINAIIREGMRFLHEYRFSLPSFGGWTPEQWIAKGSEIQEIVENHLGWDITDFGSGHFNKCGLLLFTLRNGRSANLKSMKGKLYAEKIVIVEVGQVTPLHFHWQKTEDIINRGGGKLEIQLYQSTQDGVLANTDILVSVDGVVRKVSAGACVTLSPGESITLPPGLYHKFWGTKKRVLVGEVSVVNDDISDNRFYESIGRFPQITEDEPPAHLLTIDYPNYCRGVLNRTSPLADKAAGVVK